MIFENSKYSELLRLYSGGNLVKNCNISIHIKVKFYKNVLFTELKEKNVKLSSNWEIWISEIEKVEEDSISFKFCW